ncbi:Zn-ribbon domain-containing OB-fold protein [Chloroflexota bacterium]
MVKQIPITEGLFTWPSEKPQLIGGTCKTCGSYYFPKRSIVHKPGCLNEDVEEVLFSREGKLISYTWQYYQPPPPFKSSEPFVPFGLGLVELAEGVRVNGIMTDCKLEDLKMNMDVQLVARKLYDDEQGNEYMTWMFRPI